MGLLMEAHDPIERIIKGIGIDTEGWRRGINVKKNCNRAVDY